MSAVESSDDFCMAELPERPGWRSTPSWIATVRHRLHRQLCTAHGWAAGLNVAEGLWLYHVTAAAISQLIVLAKGAAARRFKRSDVTSPLQSSVTLGNMSTNSMTHLGNVRAAIVIEPKRQNGARS